MLATDGTYMYRLSQSVQLLTDKNPYQKLIQELQARARDLNELPNSMNEYAAQAPSAPVPNLYPGPGGPVTFPETSATRAKHDVVQIV